MEPHRQTDFDFSKAFELLDNDVSLNKFFALSTTPKLLSFLTNYLKNRRQLVQMSSLRSKLFYTRSCVSQESDLDPTQFLIVVDDLKNCII